MVKKNSDNLKKTKTSDAEPANAQGGEWLCANDNRLPLREKDPNELLRRNTGGKNATVGSRKGRTCRGNRPVINNTI